MEHVNRIIARAAAHAGQKDRQATVSASLPDGALLETVYEPAGEVTGFALWRNGRCERIPELKLSDGRRLTPYSPRNNLVAHGVVRFPSGPEDYESDRALASSVQAFIHRYVEVSPLFERIATYYVLLTWLYDVFNELPYLRVRGEPGCGKTRFLLTVGSLCYKPIFASGASTVSPIFRMLDAIQGTLVIDESDFRVSDEKAEIVKILNNGNVRGFPVLRSEQVAATKEFNPRAYHVFGPKIVATRGFFEDAALESRFLTERMDADRLREDIPINLPACHSEEALRLRNQLLMFRFRSLGKPRRLEESIDRSLEPRLNQIFAPLLSIVEDEETRADLQRLARTYQREMTADRGLQVEAHVLELARDLWTSGDKPPSVKEIAARFDERHGAQYPHFTPKRVGWMLRRKLGLATTKTGGVYVIDPSEGPRLRRLCARYGIDAENDLLAEGHPSSPGSQREASPQAP